MRLIKVTGGLGNQMFIYAFYMQMKKRFPHVYIDLSDMVHYHVHYGYEMNHVFNLPRTEFCMNQTLKKVIEFLFFKTILERKQKGSMKPYERSYVWPLIYFKGFYQSEKYFEGIKDEVRQAFTFDLSQANEKSLKMLARMDNEDNTVSLHVRRGDYLQAKHWNAIGHICQLPYYQNALSKLKELVAEPVFYVFSDDIDWVKDNLPLENAIFVDWNKGTDSPLDMYLMSQCRYGIIANSTFSYWGAVLGENKCHVIYPQKWWNNNAGNPNIFPEGWISL